MNSADQARAHALPTPWVLYLAMLSIGMGQTVIYAVMPALGRELGLDAIIITLPFSGIDWQPGKLAITSLSAMTALVFALVAPFWGRRSDRVGRKPIILLGLMGYTVGTLLFNAVAYLGFQGVIGGALLWFLLIAARVAHATIMSATFPASNAYIVDVTPLADRAKGLGRMSAANQLGVLMGPVMAAAVVAGFLVPLFIQAAITFVCAVMIYFYLIESRPARDKASQNDADIQAPIASHPLAEDDALNPEERELLEAAVTTQVLAENVCDNVGEITASRPEAHSDKPLPKLSIWDPRFRFILPVGFLLYTMQGMVQQTLGFYCEDVLGMPRLESVQYYATAMMASSVAMLVAQLLVVQRAALSSTQLMRIGLPFCAIGYAIVAATSNIPGMLAGMMVFGFGVGMVMPGFTATASYTVSPKEQGSLAGITGATAGMGFVVGPLMGGSLYNLSYDAPYIVAAVSLLILAVYVVKNPRFDTAVAAAVD